MALLGKLGIAVFSLSIIKPTSHVAKKLRYFVRKEERVKDMKKINVVFSSELPKKQAKIVGKEGRTLKETLPPSSVIFSPSVAGLLCASYICNKES